jgi:predicted AlkP superfamily phosphohydrolase/phosphomutase
MLVFNGTDTASHALWKFMDPAHPLHDPHRRAKYGDAIRDYYQFCDRYLGRVMDELDDNTTLVVMSDHGFGPFHKFIHVNNWLIQSGFMQIRSGLLSRLKAAMFRAGFSPMGVYNALMRVGLGALKREVVRGQGQGLLKALFLSFEDIDWPHTQAYSLGNVGQIRLNVAGREPFGCVQPGAEYTALRQRIIDQVLQLTDPATGETVVEAAYTRDQLYSGSQLEEAPDIVFMPRRLEYFGFGEYEFGSHKVIEAMTRGISGTHRMQGIFLAYGQSIKPDSRVEGGSLTDLAPTILHLMGEAVPGHMDGRVLSEALANNFEPASARYDETLTVAGLAPIGDVLTAEDEELLGERLHGLGYVG